MLSLDPVVEELQGLLPPRFEDLRRDFAVAVVDTEGEHVLIEEGPLARAVAASAAIPVVFSRVEVPSERARGCARPLLGSGLPTTHACHPLTNRPPPP